jgi:hypothetical protein
MAYPELTCQLVRELYPEGILGLRFTEDDNQLVSGWSGSLVRFELMTGNMSYIPVGTSAALLPDETSDGTTIAYVRALSSEGTLWQYNLSTFRDSLVRINGAVSYGSYPRFSAGDSLLLYMEVDGLHVAHRSTGQGVRITRTDYPRNYHSVPRWLDSRRVLFNEVFSGGQRYFIVDRMDGTLDEVPEGLFDSEAVAPGGDSIIVQGFDRSDPNETRVVLFVRNITSPASTARQITWFVPEAPSAWLISGP